MTKRSNSNVALSVSLVVLGCVVAIALAGIAVYDRKPLEKSTEKVIDRVRILTGSKNDSNTKDSGGIHKIRNQEVFEDFESMPSPNGGLAFNYTFMDVESAPNVRNYKDYDERVNHYNYLVS